MRKTIGTLVAGAMLAVLIAAPAMADKPFTFSDSVTFPDVNPCTGLDDEITLDLVVSIHEHQNNFVVHVDRSGSTSSGFTMIAGTENFVENNNAVSGAFVDQWRHPDGSKFIAQGHFAFNINQDKLLVDSFSLRCIGNN